MSKAKLKTVPVEKSAETLVAAIDHDGKRKDAERLLAIFGRATGDEPVVWNGGIVGYGDWHYKYDSGREGDFFKVGFASRKTKHSIYLMGGLDKHSEALEQLGKWKRGAGCLYINKLNDIDEDVLEAMIKRAWHDLSA